MSKIKWGIIGCGNVTEVKSGPAFNRAPSSELVAVMRRSADKAEDYARRHGVPRWYSDADQLISDPDVNAIYIATPPAYHEQYALAALAAGKPVYVEKPVALSAASAVKMNEVASRAGVPFTVAHYRRGLAVFKRIKELLSAGAIGDIRFIRMELFQPLQSDMIAQTEENWRVDPAISGGGLFHDLAPHQLDLIVWFFGYPRHACGLALNQAGAYQADDIVSGEAVFKENILFKGLWCFSVPPEESKDVCEIIGSEGKITFSVFGNYYILSRKGKDERVEFELPAHIQQPMIEEVVKYFRGEGANPCTGQDGVTVMDLIDAFTGKGG